MLLEKPEIVMREREPLLANKFDRRGWNFPALIDKVFDSSYAYRILN